jgi:uncharacterized protein (UPF0276 family)
VPDFLFGRSGMGEGRFFEALYEASGSEVIMNIDSIVISASLQNIDPIALIKTYPLEKIVSLTVVPESCMNPVIKTMCGGFDADMLKLVQFCINNTSARSVLIQTRYASNTVESLMDVITALREIVGRKLT